jgi:hypothetical protein
MGGTVLPCWGIMLVLGWTGGWVMEGERVQGVAWDGGDGVVCCLYSTVRQDVG